MEIFKQTNFDFLGKKWPFIIASLVLTLLGLGSLFVKGGPKYGIDFNGGALMEVNFKQRPPAEQIRAALRKKISGEIEVQEVSNSERVLISTSVRDAKSLEAVRSDMLSTLNAAFNSSVGNKLDINTAGQDALMDGLRDPLAKAGAVSPTINWGQLSGRS
jgi:preprotein translocase subunit SecF